VATGGQVEAHENMFVWTLQLCCAAAKFYFDAVIFS